ncbi:MAG: D-alanyl-D-alanine carboxypeptidase family protein [Bacillota bacterium]
MSKSLALGLAVLVCGFAALTPASTVRAWPQVDAGAIMVMDVSSGRPVYSKYPDRKLKPASTTKIMTAILAIESGKLGEVVTVSERASGVEGSRIYLEEGEKQTLRDLVYALMLVSANDAAVAIGEHLAGSVEAFAELMNLKARQLGCTNTNFVNPHGLDHPNHYTTARDLALIARYAMGNPVFRQVVATKEWQIPWPVKNSTRTLYNENRLLYSEDGTGVKTGYTTSAGHCMVASAKRGNLEVIVVILNGQATFWRDIRKLIDFFFQEYSPWVVVSKGAPLGTLPLGSWPFGKQLVGLAGADLVVPLSDQEKGAVAGTKLRTEVVWQEGLRPPIRAGQIVGTAVVKVEMPAGLDLPPLEVPVVASQDVVPPRATWNSVVGWAGIGYSLMALARRARRKRRRRQRHFKHLHRRL